MLGVVPLFLITVYNMFTAQDFGWWKCKMAPGDDGSVIWSPDSFTEKCADIAIKLVIEDFPWRPAISSEEADDTRCEGIASNISNSSYLDYRLMAQYMIYAALLLFAMVLVKREQKEKRYLRVALHLDGVFLPIEDQSKVKTPFRARYPYLVEFLPYFDRFFALLLGVGYLLTLTVFIPAQQEWYVFPTKAEQEAFMNDYDEHANWCNVLSFPVFLTYSQPSSGFDLTVLAEVVLFFMAIYALSDSQASVYDWIDPDSYMNHKKRSMCSYYDIHLNRNRIFNELMLDDWIVAYVEGPLIKNILTNDQHKPLRNMLSSDELEKLQIVSDSVSIKTALSHPDL